MSRVHAMLLAEHHYRGAMPSEEQLLRLARLEKVQAERRRLNRAMVQPTKDPDSGQERVLEEAPSARAANAQAAGMVRSWMILPPVGRAPRPPQAGLVGEANWVRPLELALCGCTKQQTAQILGCTIHQVDTALRRAYGALGVHTILEAGVAWRARARAEGHQMNEDDARAVRDLYSEPEPAGILSQRQEEAMRLLAKGVARRDLGAHLGCGQSAVGSLLYLAYKKLGARGQRDAVLRFLERYGGIGQPPYDRPLAAHFYDVPLELGAKAGSDDDIGIPDTRYCPP
jgi:DNA-binding CsgD family transcriptional regulator